MSSDLLFTVDQLDQMTTHLESCLPEEACGLVGGTKGIAKLVLPIENDLHSPVRFRMAPLAQLKAFDLIEGRGWELLAIFHSHPQGPAYPSATDIAEFFYPGTVVIVASPLQRDKAKNRSSEGLAWGKWQFYGFEINHNLVHTVKLDLAA